MRRVEKACHFIIRIKVKYSIFTLDYLLSIFPDKNETKSQVKTKRKLSARTASTRPPFCRATARVLFSGEIADTKCSNRYHI
ncbi:MAG: hypothetical protein KKA07_17330 [Bacteroidetes bacterium]|nr:hypothetical protein [Bacteroidota bacterium]MBU1720832.1 hypothetical protein [Bacteroidota bacterium]